MYHLSRPVTTQRLSIAILFLALLTIGGLSLRTFFGYDVFWHLRAGHDLVERGLLPWADHYSFTYSEMPVDGMRIAFGLLTEALTRGFGLIAGLRLTRFLLHGALVLLLWWHARRQANPLWLQALSLLWLCALLDDRNLLRPELLSLLLAGMAMRFHSLVPQPVLGWRRGLASVLLLGLWSNVHSAVIGYVILGGFFFQQGVGLLKRRAPSADWVSTVAWGLAALTVGFMTPDAAHDLFLSLRLDPFWTQVTREYAPISVRAGSSVVVLSLAGVLVLTCAALVSGRIGLAFSVGVLGVQTVLTQRLLLPAATVALFAASIVASDPRWREGWQHARRGARGAAVALAITTVLLLLSRVGESLIQRLQDGGELSTNYPSRIVADMASRHLRGRVFNDLAIGGFLLHGLAPSIQVFIDGRTNILYPVEHGRLYLEMKTLPQTLLREVQARDIAFAVVSSDEFEVYSVARAGVFGLDAADHKHVLMRRGPSRYPALGHWLLRPECIRREDQDAVRAEIFRPDALTALAGPLRDAAVLLRDLLASADGLGALRRAREKPDLSDAARRVAGHLALALGDRNLAISYLGSQVEPRLLDHIHIAHLLAASADTERARAALALALQHPNSVVFYRPELEALQSMLDQQSARTGTSEVAGPALGLACVAPPR